jgi:phage terminase large subunit-like protein
VDYEYIQLAIEKAAKDYNLQYLCSDPWQVEMLRQILQKKGIETIPIAQTIAGMSPGMKALDKLFRAKEISHDKNPLGRWCFGNVIVATDGNENLKPMKNKSIERIDPIVALVNAMNGAIKLETKINVYETRGMRSLA